MVNPEGLKEKEPKIPDGRKPEEDQDGKEKDVSPEGRKDDEPEEERCACTTGGTEHLTSQVVKETIQTDRKIRKIPDLFRSQEKKILERDMDRLRK